MRSACWRRWRWRVRRNLARPLHAKHESRSTPGKARAAFEAARTERRDMTKVAQQPEPASVGERENVYSLEAARAERDSARATIAFLALGDVEPKRGDESRVQDWINLFHDEEQE